MFYICTTSNIVKRMIQICEHLVVAWVHKCFQKNNNLVLMLMFSYSSVRNKQDRESILRPRLDIFKIRLSPCQEHDMFVKIITCFSRPFFSRSCHTCKDNVMFAWTNLIRFDSIWSVFIQFDQNWSNLNQNNPTWYTFDLTCLKHPN